MDLQKALIVVGITLAVVLIANGAIYYSIMRRNRKGSRGGFSEVELLRKAAQRARDPWFSEDESLRELSKRVAEIKDKAKDSPPLPEDESANLP